MANIIQTELPSSVPASQDHKPFLKRGLYKPRLAQGQQQQHRVPAASPRFNSSGRIPDNGIVQSLRWEAASSSGTDIPRARAARVAKPSATRCHSPFVSSPWAAERNEREGSKEIMNSMQKQREQFPPILTLLTSEIEGIVCCSKVLITQAWESKSLMCLEGIKHPVKIEFPSVFWCLSIR